MSNDKSSKPEYTPEQEQVHKATEEAVNEFSVEELEERIAPVSLGFSELEDRIAPARIV